MNFLWVAMKSQANSIILFVLWFGIKNCAGLPEQTDILCGENAESRYRVFPNWAKKLKLIRLDSGQVCDTTIQPKRKEKYYDYIEKNVDCLGLFESPVLEQTALQEDIDPKTYRPPGTVSYLSIEIVSKPIVWDFSLYISDINLVLV